MRWGPYKADLDPPCQNARLCLPHPEVKRALKGSSNLERPGSRCFILTRVWLSSAQGPCSFCTQRGSGEGKQVSRAQQKATGPFLQSRRGH